MVANGSRKTSLRRGRAEAIEQVIATGSVVTQDASVSGPADGGTHAVCAGGDADGTRQLWLISALLFFTTAVSLFVWPRWWWVTGAGATVVSMFVIVPSWEDAKAGALANAVVLAGVAFGFLRQGPFSLRAEHFRDVERHVSAVPSAEPITDADLAHLPAPVQRYLRVAGVVGQPTR